MTEASQKEEDLATTRRRKLHKSLHQASYTELGTGKRYANFHASMFLHLRLHLHAMKLVVPFWIEPHSQCTFVQDKRK
jgi:hypothetical protein